MGFCSITLSILYSLGGTIIESVSFLRGLSHIPSTIIKIKYWYFLENRLNLCFNVFWSWFLALKRKEVIDRYQFLYRIILIVQTVINKGSELEVLAHLTPPIGLRDLLSISWSTKQPNNPLPPCSSVSLSSCVLSWVDYQFSCLWLLFYWNWQKFLRSRI